MGGRGTYAAGNNAAYRYKTVDKIEGVKVLVGKNGMHDLPMESHPNCGSVQNILDVMIREIPLADAERL